MSNASPLVIAPEPDALPGKVTRCTASAPIAATEPVAVLSDTLLKCSRSFAL